MPKVFSDDAIRTIRDVVRQVLAEPRTKPGDKRPTVFPMLTFYLGKTDGSGITARSGTTPGSGTVTLYYIPSTTLDTWKDASSNAITVTAYNMSTTAVAASAYVMLAQEILSGKLFAVWEDC